MEGPGGIETEITRNALSTITDLMALTVVRTARSPIVRNGLDFSSAIMTATGELVGQGVSHPMHMASTVPALRSCLKHYQDPASTPGISLPTTIHTKVGATCRKYTCSSQSSVEPCW